MRSALTIDVEDYWSVLARDHLDLAIPPSRAVVRNTRRLLDLLAARDVQATFFILGEVAETYPGLVGDLAQAGHEIGVHGSTHQQVFKLTPETFRDEVGRAKRLLEDITGDPVEGHRAPAFSIGPETAWALDVLADLGFRYDSSIFPFAGPRYGWPGYPRGIHAHALEDGRSIVEAPLTTLEVFGKRLPCCGGGYLRLLPWPVTWWAMRSVTKRRPAIVYLHPYELDLTSGPDEVEAALAAGPEEVRTFHARQLRQRRTVEPKLRKLLARWDFAPLGEVIDDAIRR